MQGDCRSVLPTLPDSSVQCVVTSPPYATFPAPDLVISRNLRNVWTIATEAFPQAHFATFPTALAERCIRAGTKPGDTVLDPFGGAGTVGLVADRLQRAAIGIELSPAYCEMARQRIAADGPLFNQIELFGGDAAPVADDAAD
jgi:DNA modification methylase